jgi:biopolymer transport protein ExbD
MAEKRRFYDLWIVEANTVYQEVPFDVVADWVQQGRLLEDDMMRPSGTAEWRRLGDFMDFSVYIPKPRAEPEPPSAVEPMEPVEPGFSWRRRPELEEAEVDMIPLIDVSLVLLIFFMLTTKDIGGGGPPVPTPAAENGEVAAAGIDSAWVAVDLIGDGPNRRPIYSCGAGGISAKAADRDLATQGDLLQHLQTLLAGRRDIDLTINARPDVKTGDVRQLTVALSQEPYRSEIGALYTGVSDKRP